MLCSLRKLLSVVTDLEFYGQLRNLCHRSYGPSIQYQVYIRYLVPQKLFSICVALEVVLRSLARSYPILLDFLNYPNVVQEITSIRLRKEHKGFLLMVPVNTLPIQPLLVFTPLSWLRDGFLSSLGHFPHRAFVGPHVMARSLPPIWRQPATVAVMGQLRLPQPEVATSGHRSRASTPPATTVDRG